MVEENAQSKPVSSDTCLIWDLARTCTSVYFFLISVQDLPAISFIKISSQESCSSLFFPVLKGARLS